MTRYLLIIFQFGGALLYVYTSWLAFTLSGLLATIISAVLPGIANLYWIFQMWSVTGDLFNFYTVANAVWLGTLAFKIFLLKSS